MKLLILTTQTIHHTKFVQEIAALWPKTKAVIETRTLVAPFDTAHNYLEKQDAYERANWFSGDNLCVLDVVDTLTVENINDSKTLDLIKEFSPDLIIVFGTGKILTDIINLVPGRIINLHGGDPEQYRGLDTHLWAIYHGQPEQLITCLHDVAPDLDTGAVIGKMQIPLHQNMELFHLRTANTDCCIRLVLDAVDNFKEQGDLSATPQVQKGRYYSFMPTVLKDICVKKFRKFTQ